MGDVIFYHLTRRPLEDALPPLLSRALARGWRVAVRGTDADRLDRLDRLLWLDDGFLPHGRAGGAHDALQPILLSAAAEAANGATCLVAIDGAEVSVEEARRHDRTCILFDGGDPAAVEAARLRWRAVAAAGLAAQYWSEESGAWQKKAETQAAEAGSDA